MAKCPVIWTVTDTSLLEKATRQFIACHGLTAFMDEYYNLLGTRPSADLNARNHELAQALGLASPVNRLPLTLPRSNVLSLMDHTSWAKVTYDRRVLMRFFTDTKAVPVLGEAQRLFLEWHFLAPRDYSSVLTREPRRMVVGWNAVGELESDANFAMYTFGLIGCACILAEAADGAVHMSHYDTEINPVQIVALMDFLRRHSHARVWVIGFHAQKVARHLKTQRQALPVLCHVKQDYFETNYSVRFSRCDDQISVTHCVTPLPADYIQSAHNGEYGRWFALGRFSAIYPEEDKAFVNTQPF